jgi:hypothetical protein
MIAQTNITKFQISAIAPTYACRGRVWSSAQSEIKAAKVPVGTPAQNISAIVAENHSK